MAQRQPLLRPAAAAVAVFLCWGSALAAQEPTAGRDTIGFGELEVGPAAAAAPRARAAGMLASAARGAALALRAFRSSHPRPPPHPRRAGGVARRGGAPVVAAARVCVPRLPVGRGVRPHHRDRAAPGRGGARAWRPGHRRRAPALCLQHAAAPPPPFPPAPQAKPKLVVSDVVDNDTGEHQPSASRTSSGTFLEGAQDGVVAAVERRVAQVTMTPLGARAARRGGLCCLPCRGVRAGRAARVLAARSRARRASRRRRPPCPPPCPPPQENQENMQVLRYVNGQKYGERGAGAGGGGWVARRARGAVSARGGGRLPRGVRPSAARGRLPPRPPPHPPPPPPPPRRAALRLLPGRREQAAGGGRPAPPDRAHVRARAPGAGRARRGRAALAAPAARRLWERGCRRAACPPTTPPQRPPPPRRPAARYLSTPGEGGETVFPASATQTPVPPGASYCASRGGLVHAPRRGDLLLFYALRPDGREDESSLHGSCPTLKGEKWSATLWVHVGRYQERGDDGRPLAEPRRAARCRDENEQCAEWAFFGGERVGARAARAGPHAAAGRGCPSRWLLGSARGGAARQPRLTPAPPPPCASHRRV